MISKQTPHRDEDYLKFLRSRPCSFCANPAEPHHGIRSLAGLSPAGMAQKGSDYVAIPVCRSCHTKIHEGTLRPERVELLDVIIINLVCHLSRMSTCGHSLANSGPNRGLGPAWEKRSD